MHQRIIDVGKAHQYHRFSEMNHYPEGLLSLPQLGDPMDGMNLNDWSGSTNTNFNIYGLLDAMERPPAEPTLEITEQPKQKDHRFRYPCEGRTAGALLGVKSTERRKTCPEVKITNLACRAKIIGSLVTKDDNKPHPFKLVGRDCENGIVQRIVDPKNPRVRFESLGIQCVTKKGLKGSLEVRKQLYVDPFNNLDRVLQEDLQELDCKVVRICFQAFLENPNTPGRFDTALKPVTTQKIYNKKDTNLKIMRMNKEYGIAKGGEEIYIFCEKVDKDDIQVEFYEEREATVIWRGYGVFGPSDVHHQIAIVLKTPSYQSLKIDSDIEVKISLKRPSDDDRSDPWDFTYIPEISLEDGEGLSVKRKRKFDATSYLSIKDEPGSSGESSSKVSRHEQVRNKLRDKVKRNRAAAAIKEEAAQTPSPQMQEQSQAVDPFSFPSVSNPNTNITVQSETTIGHVTVKGEVPRGDFSMQLPPELFSNTPILLPGCDPSESGSSVELDFSPASQEGEMRLLPPDIPITTLEADGLHDPTGSFGAGMNLSAGQLANILNEMTQEAQGTMGNPHDPILSQHNMTMEGHDQLLPPVGSFFEPLGQPQEGGAPGESPSAMEVEGGYMEGIEEQGSRFPF